MVLLAYGVVEDQILEVVVWGACDPFLGGVLFLETQEDPSCQEETCQEVL